MPDQDSDKTAFYITTPIYYVSGKPHIGSAYTNIATDVLARYHRLRGETVVFATGTDEHGQKVVRGAAEAGKSPQDFADILVGDYQRAWERLHVSHTHFIRTTEEQHVHVVQEIFARLLAQDDIYLSEYTGWYCVPCETYLLEADLLDGNCPECGRPVEQVAERAYFFRTSNYADRLIRHIEENDGFIAPESRRNEVLAFIRNGLHDACISRTKTDWDIPVPDDETQSVYVWLDALINYLTVAGFTTDDEQFAAVWPPDVQLMGKDILIRFHGTLWPAMLMALELPLSRCLFAHGWWNDEHGQKMSKSKGNVVDPFEVIDRIVEYSGVRTKFGVDTLRYYLLREVPFGADGNFSYRGILQRFNADLANDLGNLLHRTLPLVERYLDGRVPDPGPAAGALSDDITQTVASVQACLDEINFRDALMTVWEFIARCNKFIDHRAPWTLHKQGKRVELDAVLYDMLDAIRVIAILIDPFMPEVAEEIWDQLGLSEAALSRAWGDLQPQRLQAGITIQRGAPIFPRMDLDRALAKLANSKAPPQPENPSEDVPQQPDDHKADGADDEINTISFADFQRLDLRTGRVIEAARIPGTDKLLVLQVDIGEDQPRQVVAGLAARFNPRQLLGRSVVLVANLEPATIHGTQSNGMILAAGEKEPLALIASDDDVAPGEKVR
jgi:methionyl-tRNA synthetase